MAAFFGCIFAENFYVCAIMVMGMPQSMVPMER